MEVTDKVVREKENMKKKMKEKMKVKKKMKFYQNSLNSEL